MNDRPREEEFTYSAPGCLAPQSDWKHGWKLMDQLFHHSRQQAAERIKTEFIDACDEDELSSLSDVLTRRSNDWDFIEKFTHLYQVWRILLKLFSCNVLKHNFIFKAARGVQQTQISEKVDRLSRLEAIQKGLMESVDDPDSPSPLIQVPIQFIHLSYFI